MTPNLCEPLKAWPVLRRVTAPSLQQCGHLSAKRKPTKGRDFYLAGTPGRPRLAGSVCGLTPLTPRLLRGTAERKMGQAEDRVL